MKPQVNQAFKLPTNQSELSLGSSCVAGILTAVNAGWRTFKPVIDQDKCIRCLLCWVYCPEGVIGKENEKLEIDYDYCKGCGICAHECPQKAIDMVREAVK